MNVTRWVTPGSVYALGIAVMLLSLPAVIWAFQARLSPYQRLRIGVAFAAAGTAILGVSLVWYGWQARSVRRRRMVTRRKKGH